jgi:uncharacterized protein YuzE
MTLSYDARADVLYVTFRDGITHQGYLENEDGDVIRFNQENQEIVGCTILFFQERARAGRINVPEIRGYGERLIASRFAGSTIL